MPSAVVLLKYICSDLLADFLSNWDISQGDYTGPILCFFAVFFYILFARRFSEAAMGGAEVRGIII